MIVITDSAGLERLSDLLRVTQQLEFTQLQGSKPSLRHDLLPRAPEAQSRAGRGLARDTLPVCRNWAMCPGVLTPARPTLLHSQRRLGPVSSRGTLMMKRVVGRMWRIRPHRQAQKPLGAPSLPLADQGKNLFCFKGQCHLPLKAPSPAHLCRLCSPQGTALRVIVSSVCMSMFP